MFFFPEFEISDLPNNGESNGVENMKHEMETRVLKGSQGIRVSFLVYQKEYRVVGSYWSRPPLL